MPIYEETIIAGVGIEAEAWGLLGAGEGDYVEIAPAALFPVPVGGWGGIGGGVSLNSGCGVLEYSRDNSMTPPDNWYWDLPYDIILVAFFPAFMYTPWWPPTISDNLYPARLDKSYILEVAAGLAGQDERSCYRLEITVNYAAHADPLIEDGISDVSFYMTHQRYTPLGSMDLIETTKVGCDVGSGGHAYPITDKKDFDSFDSGRSKTGYSDVVMFQCYALQISSQYRTNNSGSPLDHNQWVYVDDPAMFTSVQIAVDYNTDITDINPKNQTRIAALEAKVIEAMNAAAAEDGDEKCIDYMQVTIRE